MTKVLPFKITGNKNIVLKKIFKCNICGLTSNTTKVREHNLRESINCEVCNSNNRHRQLVKILLDYISKKSEHPSTSLMELNAQASLKIYNTETKGPIANQLSQLNNIELVQSEYFDSMTKSGTYYNDVLHVDLQKTHFESEIFDVVLSTEVFEHIPDPYKAFKEVHRILKKDGRHIFTVPFLLNQYCDDVRTRIEEGKTYKYADDIFHSDPIRKDGILVYTLFSIEMLVHLERIGFKTNVYKLENEHLGIYGNNAFVFESIKIKN